MNAEEPVISPDVAEVEQSTAVAEPTQAEAQPEPTPVDLYALLTAEVGDTDNPQLDELAKTITAETIQGWDDATKALHRAVLRQVKAAETKAGETVKTREAELTKREAEIAANARRVQQQRQAFLDMAARAPANPGKAPESDPFTAEGQRALAEYNARKVASEAWAPILAEREEVAKANGWAALCEKHPELNDPKVGGEDGEFDKFFRSKNPGLDKGVVAINANDAADIFFNARELERLRSQAAKSAETRTTDRAAAARAVGRSAGAGQPDPAQKVVEILRQHGHQAAYAYVQQNPTARDAFVRAQGLA